MKQISMVRHVFQLDANIYTGLGVEVAGFGYVPWDGINGMRNILNSLYAVSE
jgi:hypothetical protein